jgi:Tfp pilus assembly pilus retraction ATPase PilT
LVESWVKKYQLQEDQTKDFTEELEGVRYRVHLFCSKRGWNAALRLLPSKILSFDVKKMYYLVLIAGLCNQNTLFLLDIYYLSY